MASSSVDTAVATSPRPGRDAVLLGGLLALVALLYQRTIESLIGTWTADDSSQNHGLLLFAVTLYLLFRQWRLQRSPLRFAPSLLGLGALLGLSLVWLLAVVASVEAVEQAALVLIAAALLWATLGWRGARPYLFPILLLLSVVPLWEVLIWHLQKIAAIPSGVLVDLIGIPSVREGFLILIPNGTFEVAPSCSGLGYQVVGVTIALIYGHLARLSAPVMALLAAVTWFLAYCANVLRIVTVVVIGHLYGMEHPMVQDHGTIGWVIFAAFIFVFLSVVRRYLPEPPAAPVAAVYPTGSPGRAVAVALGVAALVAAGPAAALLLAGEREPAGAEFRLEPDLGGWQRTEGAAGWQTRWIGGDASVRAGYRRGGERIDLELEWFLTQRQNREAVHRTNRPYDDRWTRFAREARTIALSGGGNLAVLETRIRAVDGQERMVWTWYYTARRHTASELRAKLYNALATLVGEPEIVALNVASELRGDPAAAHARLAAFVAELLPRLDRMLPQPAAAD